MENTEEKMLEGLAKTVDFILDATCLPVSTKPNSVTNAKKEHMFNERVELGPDESRP